MLEVDVLVEQLEHSSQLTSRAARPQQPRDQLSVSVVGAHTPPPVWPWSSSAWPAFVGGYGDIALRDFGLLLGALTLARLAGADFSSRTSPPVDP